MPKIYYNEFEPYAANWLENLIAAGQLPNGDVDRRDIRDVVPGDLTGYTQHHFFAGIGGWPLALRLAGWPDDKPVWTGSCPCQPFSAAGKGVGFADERHLWPAWFWLIEKLRPSVIFGEQVANKHAEPWLDLVQTDLEAVGYAVGAIPFPAAGIGAPHIRDRLYWVADPQSERSRPRLCDLQLSEHGVAITGDSSSIFGMGHAEFVVAGRDARTGDSTEERDTRGPFCDDARSSGAACGLGPTNRLWRDADWLFCRDGKWRPVEPGTFPLAHGAPARVGRLRVYGNAIVPQQAKEFIKSYMNEG